MKQESIKPYHRLASPDPGSSDFGIDNRYMLWSCILILPVMFFKILYINLAGDVL